MLESWKCEANLVKSLIEWAGDLAEGMWNSCSDILEEWGIGEIKESMEYLTPKIEVIERARAAFVADILDLEVVDSEVIHLSLISPMQMATQVDEHAMITRKGIKEIASLVIQVCLHSRLTKGPEAEDVIEVSNKWEA